MIQMRIMLGDYLLRSMHATLVLSCRRSHIMRAYHSRISYGLKGKTSKIKVDFYYGGKYGTPWNSNTRKLTQKFVEKHKKTAMDHKSKI